MVLNYIWIGFFIIAFVVGLVKVIFMGDTDVFTTMMNSTFASVEAAFNRCLVVVARCNANWRARRCD